MCYTQITSSLFACHIANGSPKAPKIKLLNAVNQTDRIGSGYQVTANHGLVEVPVVTRGTRKEEPQGANN